MPLISLQRHSALDSTSAKASEDGKEHVDQCLGHYCVGSEEEFHQTLY